MKIFITLILVSISSCTFAQSSAQNWEKAIYNQRKNQTAIYSYKISPDNHDFSLLDIEALTAEFFSKEGMIDVTKVSNNLIIVYANSFIDIDLVKQFFVIFDPNISIESSHVLSEEEATTIYQSK